MATILAGVSPPSGFRARAPIWRGARAFRSRRPRGVILGSLGHCRGCPQPGGPPTRGLSRRGDGHRLTLGLMARSALILLCDGVEGLPRAPRPGGGPRDEFGPEREKPA
jgi:hypothetical protein